MFENDDVPMIPKHQAENQLMHMSWAVRKIVEVAIAGFITVIIAILIFVSSYNARTKDWLNTFDNLLQKVTVTEAGDDIQQQTPP